MSMKNVLAEELERISLSEKEVLKLKRVADDFIKKLKKVGLKAVIGGSMAKGTMIRKQKFSKVGSGQLVVSREDFVEPQDVDVFVVFDYSEDILGLGGVLKKMDLGDAELKVVHGSRDYFHVIYPDVILEVVPVVRNKDPELAENVTDVSLSHVEYIVSEIKKRPFLSEEIKLAKAFARAQGCYGAEGYIRGFSGYSLEILVIYFGGMLEFLKGIGKKQVIDPMKYFKSEREVMREINSSKLQGPVVVVDPTYKFRNVCAGLGLSTFERFLEASNKFLKNPSLEFFEKKKVDIEGMKMLAQRKNARFLEVELFSDRQEGDISGTKMKKIFGFFARELERAGQIVLGREFDYFGFGHEARGYLIVLEKKVVERKGPSVGLEEQAQAFLEARGDRLQAVDGRPVVFKRSGFWWCRERVSVEKVLKFVKKVESEMGAKISLL